MSTRNAITVFHDGNQLIDKISWLNQLILCAWIRNTSFTWSPVLVCLGRLSHPYHVDGVFVLEFGFADDDDDDDDAEEEAVNDDVRC